MSKPDKPLTPIVGHYRQFMWWAGRERVYHNCPFYAAREHKIRNPMMRNFPQQANMVQVLVMVIGELMWINVDREDINLTPA